MPDPVNLRQARKAKGRVDRENVAAQNRLTFGQSKVNKSLNDAHTSLAARRLDGLRLDKGDDT